MATCARELLAAALLFLIASATGARGEGVRCDPKQQRLADSCANAWASKDSNVPLSPWEMSIDEGSERRRVIHQSECPTVQVLKTRPDDRMAQIRCVGAGAKGDHLWVNFESLQCFRQGGERNGAHAKSNCSRQPGQELTAFAHESFADPTRLADGIQSDIIAEAKKTIAEMQQKIWQDQDKLTALYDEKESRDVYLAVARSAKSQRAQFQKAAALYGEKCDEMPKEGSEADHTRGQRSCLLLKATAHMAGSLLARAEQALSPEARKLPLAERQETMGKAIKLFWRETEPSMIDLIEHDGLFGEHAQRRSGEGETAEYQSLVFRQLLFTGLEEKERPKLNFMRKTYEVDGSIVELHNGYVFGGSRLPAGFAGAGRDCSDFVSAVVVGWKGDMPSTDVFLSIARAKAGNPKKMKLDRKVTKGLENCFVYVNLLESEQPQPADIVVTKGHIVVVESFDPKTGAIKTLEAAGGKFNSVGAKTRPLYEPSCEAPADGGAKILGPPRADVWVLRYKEDGCDYRLNRTQI